jgi:hypothetical protein
MLDSGAYSAYAAGKNVNLLDFMEYIKANSEHLTRYVSLDVIGDDSLTRVFYEIMCSKGFDPIPVFHYGGDYETLQYYLDAGKNYIALGGTVPVRDKTLVAQWCNELHESHPGVQFHLLGSTSLRLLECDNLISCDASTWYMQAVNGFPKSIPGKTREAKRKRATANLFDIMEKFNDFSVSSNHSHI